MGKEKKNDWEVQCPRCKQTYLIDLTSVEVKKGAYFEIPCGNDLHKEVGCGAVIKIILDEQ